MFPFVVCTKCAAERATAQLPSEGVDIAIVKYASRNGSGLHFFFFFFLNKKKESSQTGAVVHL